MRDCPVLEQLSHRVNDVAESLDDEDWGHHVTPVELIEGLDTDGHELLSLLNCPRCKPFQHLQ